MCLSKITPKNDESEGERGMRADRQVSRYRDRKRQNQWQRDGGLDKSKSKSTNMLIRLKPNISKPKNIPIVFMCIFVKNELE